MREIVPARRPDYLDGLEQEPILGIYDMGDQIQNPMRLKDSDDYKGGDVTFRDYRALAFPPLTAEADGELTPEDFGLPNHPVIDTQIGVSNYSYPESSLPVNMYSSGHIAHFNPTEAKTLQVNKPLTFIETSSDAFEVGAQYPDIFLGDKECTPILLIGERAITEFLRGFGDTTEADSPKRMPWRQGDHLLPRVDWDLLSLTVTGNLAGAPAETLPIPEEHRFRILVGLADTLSWYYTQHRHHLDTLRKPEKQFKDHSDYLLNMEMNSPLDLINRIFHGSHYQFYGNANPNIAYLIRAYRIHPDELVEATQQLWYAHTYWFEGSEKTPMNDLRDYFYQPPDPNNSRLFVAHNSAKDIAYYNEIIRTTVYAAVNPAYRNGDTPYKK
jgi:hypothetical protein